MGIIFTNPKRDNIVRIDLANPCVSCGTHLFLFFFFFHGNVMYIRRKVTSAQTFFELRGQHK